MENKKGFTLVELLSVIVVIALIGTLIITNVVQKGNMFRSFSDKKVEEMFISAAKSYVNSRDNVKIELKSGNNVAITYQTLLDLGYIKEDISKFTQDEQYNMNQNCVCVSYSDYKYNYELKSTVSACTD